MYQTAPQAPTVADLLGQSPVDPRTSAQEQARQMFAERMAAIQGANSLPQAISNVGGHIANAIMARKDMARAKEKDRLATEQEAARRDRVANALAGAGVSPEQAVSMASGAPQDNALVMNLMGMKRDEQRDQRDYDWRTGRAEVEDNRHADLMGLKRDQFGASQSNAAADRALKEQQIAAAGRPKEPSIISTLRYAGINPESAEGQAIIRDSLTGAAEGQNATQFGSVPAGMARVADPNAEAGYRIVPLEGSKEQREAAGADEKKMLRQEKDKQDFETMMRDINRVLGMSREGAGGPIQGQLAETPIIGPMTGSGQMAKHLEAIKANIAFDELQAMRDSSPTGGAVGQLTDKERDALAATAGSLDPALPEEDMQRNLIDLGVKRITAVHGTDGQIDAALKSGRITPEQAEQGRAIRDQQIAEFTSGGVDQQPAPAFAPEQIETLEQEGAALEQQYIANGMDPREAEQLVMDELKKKYGL